MTFLRQILLYTEQYPGMNSPEGCRSATRIFLKNISKFSNLDREQDSNIIKYLLLINGFSFDYITDLLTIKYFL